MAMWKERYRLGVARIDEQHRELFRMTEDLIRAAREGASPEDCRKALGFLKDYVVYHFRDEEAYQAEIAYADIDAHRAEHRQFTQTVLDYEKRLHDRGFDQAILKDLAGTVTAWLIYHVADTDQRLVSGPEAAGDARRFHRCVDVFAHSALEVLATMAGLPLEGVRQQAAAGALPGEVFVEIGLVGDIPGTAVLGFSRQLALHLIRAMTMMEVDQLDELVQSALCEVTNIACGNAATVLAGRGIACDIRPPAVRLAATADGGAGVSIETADGGLSVAVRTDDPERQLLP